MADKLVNIVFAIDTAFMQQLGNALVFSRMQVAEAVILQLPFQLPDTQPVRQRRIDVGTLFRRQYAFIFWRIFYFTQMRDTFGQLNNHAAEIINHRQQHAANVIDLFRRDGIRMRGFQLADGGHITHAVDQVDHRGADAFTQHLFAHHFGIGQREQQRRAQRVDIHTQHGENFYHLNAAPQHYASIRMPLRLSQTIFPGFG